MQPARDRTETRNSHQITVARTDAMMPSNSELVSGGDGLEHEIADHEACDDHQRCPERSAPEQPDHQKRVDDL